MLSPYLSFSYQYCNCSGLTRDGSGLPRDGSGSRTYGSGLPRDGSSSRTYGSGLPRDGSGSRTYGSGLPHDGSGSRTYGSGLPRDGSSSRTYGSGISRDFQAKQSMRHQVVLANLVFWLNSAESLSGSKYKANNSLKTFSPAISPRLVNRSTCTILHHDV
ncbi:hypothetical protein PQG02_11055 [Nostoc sp. UHCC 0926]|uniref:hypothetical protein n=1 Tax=unclassified Nostoc TaxID=2593658 RepID=UPI00235E5305|nr:hypothetical protein [Nostoc sp. UHCC 0926]WDD34812.1 hypothetical protein PQG02_11055 [Nostoc sp. UHCC 0926]